MSAIPQVADAEAKQLQLTRMKRRATGLLVLMGAMFVVAWILEPAHPGSGYVRATAEAGLVGGVADWFAITALFRHPLNIPIPHTAIIPQRKDRIGRSLGNFVQNNFLSPDVLGAKLRAAGLSRRAAEWLREPEHARSVVRQAAGALRNAAAVVRDDDVHALLERSVIEPLKRRPIAPVLADGLALLTVNDRHQQLLDRLVHGLTRVVAENEGLIRERIREESPWWVPGFVDDQVHERVVDGIERTLVEVSADSEPPAPPAARRAAGRAGSSSSANRPRRSPAPSRSSSRCSTTPPASSSPSRSGARSRKCSTARWMPPSRARPAGSSADSRRSPRPRSRTSRCWPSSTTGSSVRCSGSWSSTGTRWASSSRTR